METLMEMLMNEIINLEKAYHFCKTNLTSVSDFLYSHKLFSIFQMLKKGEYHYGREALKHEVKIAQYRRFLEKQKNNANLKKSA